MGEPAHLREMVLSDLMRAQRLILKIQDEIDPQFRIVTPEGEYWIAMTLSPDEAVRLHQMRMVSLFMAWKLSVGFVLATELVEPDVVYPVGVTRRECIGALSRIDRQPLEFGPVEWIGSESIGDDVRELLPEGSITITATMIHELEEYFGPDGRYPAVHI